MQRNPLSFAILMVVSYVAFPAPSQILHAQTRETATLEQPQSLDSLPLALNRVARLIKPHVVQVVALRTSTPATQDFPQTRFRPEPRKMMGTGVIVSSKGHILTNNHLVAGSDVVEVRLTANRVRKAIVVGSDPKSDLAVIQIASNPTRLDLMDLRPANLGDFDVIDIGERVVAVGFVF